MQKQLKKVIPSALAENSISIPVQSHSTNKSMTNFSTPYVSRSTKSKQSKLSLRRVPYPTRSNWLHRLSNLNPIHFRKSTIVELSVEDISENPLISTRSVDKVTLAKSVPTHSTAVDSRASRVKSKDEISIFPPSATSTSPVNSDRSADTSLPTSPDTAISSDDDVIITKVETCRKSENNTLTCYSEEKSAS